MQIEAFKVAPSEAKSFKNIIKKAQVEEGLKEILENLLTVNPYFRWTASECLAHPIFNDIRVKANESVTIGKISLEIDEDDAFDYEKGTSNKFTKSDLLQMLVLEVG